jgi:hypothetical protein
VALAARRSLDQRPGGVDQGVQVRELSVNIADRPRADADRQARRRVFPVRDEDVEP